MICCFQRLVNFDTTPTFVMQCSTNNRSLDMTMMHTHAPTAIKIRGTFLKSTPYPSCYNLMCLIKLIKTVIILTVNCGMLLPGTDCMGNASYITPHGHSVKITDTSSFDHSLPQPQNTARVSFLWQMLSL